jgi:N-acyl-phosphatidylethanolamine-hydrolysing phospholipase D
MHLDPPEAMQVHKDVKSELSIGMHWGTFKLTDEPLGEPLIYVQKAMKEAGISTNAFRMLKFGEMVEVGK